MNEDQKLVNILHENYNTTLQWVVAMQHGHRLDEFLKGRGYQKIAVYGMNDLGNCVVREILNSDELEILFVLDQGEPKLYFDIDCYHLETMPTDVRPDVIIVALPFLYEEIKDNIQIVSKCKTISIKDMVYEMDI